VHSRNSKLFVGPASLLISIVLLLVSCKREERHFEPPPATANGPVVMSDLQLGASGPQANAKNPFEENANALSNGKRLFSQYNCTGCHANGGGAIGPPLMDEKWIYGSEPANIYSTIIEGRPNGMPSFRHKISDDQVWELSAYVRSLSGQVRKDVAPGRSDDMNVHPSEQRLERKTPEQSAIPKSAEQP
jgi:cytochrome c oxidase cbb3-type subunit 3